MTTRVGQVVWQDAHVSQGTWNDMPVAWPVVTVISVGHIKEFEEGYIVTHSVGESEHEQVGQYICIPKGCVISVEYYKSLPKVKGA